MNDFQPLQFIQSKEKDTFSGFQFKKRKQPINWRLLASISVDRIIKQGDTSALQDILENLTFCDIESEELKNVDPNYIKLFQLAQLTIEYLLYTQEHILSKHSNSESHTKELELRYKTVTEKLESMHKETDTMSKENKQLKKTIGAYQLWSKIPGGIGNQPVATTYHRCRFCSKVFNSEYYLESHLVRRHPEQPNYIAEIQNVPAMANASALHGLDANILDKITQIIERFSAKVMETEKQLREDMDQKLEVELSKKERKLEEEYRKERSNYEKELQDLKTLMVQELEEERRLLREERLSFEALKQLQNRKESDDEDKITKENEDTDESEKSSVDRIGQDHRVDVTEMGKDEEKWDPLEKEPREKKRSSPVAPPRNKQESFDSVVWHNYINLMKEFQNFPFVSIPGLKCRYKHQGSLLEGKKNEMRIILENEMVKKGITSDTLKNEEKVKKMESNLLVLRQKKDKESCYNASMRDYILKEVDSMVKSSFKLSPSSPMAKVAVSASIPLPDKKEFFNKHKRQKSTASSTGSVAWSESLSRSVTEYEDDDEDDISEEAEEDLSWNDNAKSLSTDDKATVKDSLSRRSNALKDVVEQVPTLKDKKLSIGDEFEVSDISSDEGTKRPEAAIRTSSLKRSKSKEDRDSPKPTIQANERVYNKVTKISVDSLDNFETSDLETEDL